MDRCVHRVSHGHIDNTSDNPEDEHKCQMHLDQGMSVLLEKNCKLQKISKYNGKQKLIPCPNVVVEVVAVVVGVSMLQTTFAV